VTSWKDALDRAWMKAGWSVSPGVVGVLRQKNYGTAHDKS
jgi:hypothetical protein